MDFINLVMEVAETTKQVLQGDSGCADEQVKAVDAETFKESTRRPGWNTTTLNAFGYAPGGGASGTGDMVTFDTTKYRGRRSLVNTTETQQFGLLNDVLHAGREEACTMKVTVSNSNINNSYSESPDIRARYTE